MNILANKWRKQERNPGRIDKLARRAVFKWLEHLTAEHFLEITQDASDHYWDRIALEDMANEPMPVETSPPPMSWAATARMMGLLER